MKRFFFRFFLSVFVTFLLGIQKPNCFATEPLKAYVSIQPLAFIVERIGGENIIVHVLATHGQDPHTFEPSPKQFVQLGKAQLFFKIGLPFEARLLPKIQANNRMLKVLDSAAGIKNRKAVVLHHHKGKSNEPKEGSPHIDEESDPHIWLSPPLVKVLAKNIAQALGDIDPAHADEYHRNLIKLNKDIDAVHAKIKKALRPFAGRTFYVFHPAYGYFGETYGLRQAAVELQGKAPSPKQLAEYIKAAKSDNAKIVFVQPQFDRANATIVANAINGIVVPLDPMAKNLLQNFEELADKFEKALN